MKKIQILKNLVMGRKISSKKLINLAKLYYSYLLKKTKVKGYPAILMVEPTNFCNLQCPLCPTGNGSLKAPRGFMDFENYKKIIDEFGDYLLNLTLWNLGEPFLHEDIYKMLDYAKEKKIFTRISTNGHFFNKKENIKKLIDTKVDDLIVSLDGASQKTFSTYRKQGNFDTVIKNIKEVVREKKKQKQSAPFVELQFIVMKHNEHEIPKVKELAKEIGVDKLTLKTVSIDVGQEIDKKKCDEYLPTNEKLSRYKEDNGEIKRRDKVKNTCLRAWLSSVINWDGSVVACCYDPHRIYEFGNMFKGGNFKRIWDNEKYKRFRGLVLTNKKSIPICRNCSGKLMGLNVD